jgi:hypothetical protein
MFPMYSEYVMRRTGCAVGDTAALNTQYTETKEACNTLCIAEGTHPARARLAL